MFEQLGPTLLNLASDWEVEGKNLKEVFQKIQLSEFSVCYSQIHSFKTCETIDLICENKDKGGPHQCFSSQTSYPLSIIVEDVYVVTSLSGSLTSSVHGKSNHR